ncbi:RlpA-like double-psi beta-barrel-protein domain-containing protein-containing protein [Schizophyllum fasciatum]
MGACGQMNQASDFIVALNAGMWDGGSHCFQQITITINGKSTQATIMDECPGCEYGGLDFSQGLFEYFSSTDAGVLHGSWEYGNGAPATTSTWEPPSTTSTWEEPSTTWTPTSTWTPETTSTWSSTSEWSSSSSWSSSSESSSSSSSSSSSAEPTSSSASSTASSSSASPSASASAGGGTIEQMNLLVLQLGNVVVQAAEQD